MSLLKRIQQPDGDVPASGQSPRPSSRQSQGRATANKSQKRDVHHEIKTRVQKKLLAELDSDLDINNKAEVTRIVKELFNAILAQENVAMTRAARQALFQSILDEILGFGPIEPLIRDESVTEIMVNGPNQVYCERGGELILTPIKFDDDAHVSRIIDRIVAPLGRRCDESQPLVDARLPDGSRVNAIIRPIALKGGTITIRKFSKKPLTVKKLVHRFKSMTNEACYFLQCCVRSRLNVVVSGGTGSGKTTLLNALSNFIPDGERIITVENAAELQLQKEHVITLESRPPNIEGTGEVSIRDLVINTLRMRPDRIVVGECRGGEALDMLQAMNTGHDGSLTTAHANSPTDCLRRLETMSMMSGMDLPLRAIREQVAGAVDLIVQQSRFRDHSRKVEFVTEVQGMEGDIILTQDIFYYEVEGEETDEHGHTKLVGRMKATGAIPKFFDRFRLAGVSVPDYMFDRDLPNTYDVEHEMWLPGAEPKEDW